MFWQINCYYCKCIQHLNLGEHFLRSLTLLIQMLDKTRKHLETNELPSQMLLMFAIVADRKEVPMAELGKLTGLAQSSVSRNVAKLAQGETPMAPGFGLIEAFEDPFYRKRKLVRVTSKGLEFANALERSIK